VKYLAHLVLACSLVLFAVRPSSAADTGSSNLAPSPTAIVFEAVDGVSTGGDFIVRIEGLVQGEAEPRQLSFRVSTGSGGNGNGQGSAAAENCHRAAMLVLSKPGRYLLVFDNHGNSSVYDCQITRR